MRVFSPSPSHSMQLQIHHMEYLDTIQFKSIRNQLKKGHHTHMNNKYQDSLVRYEWLDFKHGKFDNQNLANYKWESSSIV